VARNVPSVSKPGADQIGRIRGAIQDFKKYLKAVKAEFLRITWPTRQELRAATIVVIVTLVVVTFYLYVVDVIINQIFMKLGG